MRNSPFWWILIGFMALLDLYFFQALKVVAGSASPRARTILFTLYWVLSAAAIIVLLVLPYIHFEKQAKFVRTTIFSVIAGLFFAKLIACFFFVLDDLRRATQWIAGKLFFQKPQNTGLQGSEAISRSAFLSWTGMLMGGSLFGTLIYGFGNKYRYEIRREKLAYPNLPQPFRGLKIVHISDIHSGSFTDKDAVMRGVSKILKEKPDLILFTGDLVNNVADEMKDYTDVFSKLNAPLGVYSVLGNHDYGDYVNWDSEEDKKANLERLKQVHSSMGWRLLMNEHVVLEKEGQQIALLGIENWSAKARFPKYGDLHKAYAGSENYPFKILMSHDPSHWKEEVLPAYPDIDLVLSGHTHGMQFGVEIPGLRWSPVQYVYREWAGLYETSSGSGMAAQRLYVNRGFGFIGYPGRVGILPEITVLELV
ncbi:MAG TPA: metallophosphoesterase [Chitinophagaceae bacterium]|nr:metallophosphoesterase [Chitinophagaceae bacterium]